MEPTVISELVGIFVNNGGMIACLIYFMFYNNRQQQVMITALQELKEAMISLKEDK